MKRIQLCSLIVLALIAFAGMISGFTLRTPAERLADLNALYMSVQLRYQEAYSSATTPEAADLAFRELFPNTQYFTNRYFKLAQDYPESPVAVEALIWVAVHGSQEQQVEAVKVLLERHVESDQLGIVALSIRFRTEDPETERRLRALSESPHRKVRAAATFSHGAYLLRILERKALMAENAESAANMRKYYANSTIDFWQNHSITQLEAESIFERVIADYSDVECRNGGTFGKRAASVLFELRNLQAGQMAPEIEGPDLDGVPFRLSDYRGKVVLLSFWGDW